MEFSIENAGANTKIFDVSDVNNLTEVSGTLEGTNLKVKCPADELKEYTMFNTDAVFVWKYEFKDAPIKIESNKKFGHYIASNFSNQSDYGSAPIGLIQGYYLDN